VPLIKIKAKRECGGKITTITKDKKRDHGEKIVNRNEYLANYIFFTDTTIAEVEMFYYQILPTPKLYPSYILSKIARNWRK